MHEFNSTGSAARETVAHLHRLGEDESLALADRKACLMASEWIAHGHDVKCRLDAAEAFLNEELRRCEMTLTKLCRRRHKQQEPLHGAALIAELRRVRQELETALPVTPTAFPFGVPTA